MYKVSLCVSKTSLPISFCTHAFILTQKGNEINRWEVLDKRVTETHPSNYCGRIFKNFLPPNQGLWIFPFSVTGGAYWTPKIIATIVGDEESLAAEIYNFIELQDGLKTYPYTYAYNLIFGPNSNSFMQWLIDTFPDLNWTLPWNAWGKGYKIET